jgi:hypothetical protein
MRLWSIHPKYLDPQGLVAVWREALLAQAVLRGETKGYRNHPQLDRFWSQSLPLMAISTYLKAVHIEACSRGYSFDSRKITLIQECELIPVTFGQLWYEFQHLLRKLSRRNPTLHRKWRAISSPESHPLFLAHPGNIEPWERERADA